MVTKLFHKLQNRLFYLTLKSLQYATYHRLTFLHTFHAERTGAVLEKSRIAAIKIYERAKNSQWDYSHKRVPDPVINAVKRNSTLKLDSAQLARNAKSKVLSSSPAQPSQPKEEKLLRQLHVPPYNGKRQTRMYTRKY